MESRDTYGSESERVKVSDKPIKKKTKKSPETVRLILQRDLRLKYTGPKSGKLYIFAGAGSIIDVDKEDAGIMLEKHGGTCCEGSGSTKPQPYFVKV